MTVPRSTPAGPADRRAHRRRRLALLPLLLVLGCEPASRTGEPFLARLVERDPGEPLPFEELLTASSDATPETVDRDRLAEAAARPWKLDLGDESRNGVLGVPGRPVRWRTEAPRSAELRFAYGVLGPCREATRFEVALVEPDVRRTLFSRSKPCRQSGWQEARVPLDRDAPGPLTLELVTDSGGGIESSGLPVWAGVELMAGRRPAGLNVVLVSIDTLRPDHLSLYGYRRRTTPRLEERAERGAVVFERAVASAPWTLPSHTSIFTGLDADRHGVNLNRGLPPSLLTLAEILRNEGYATQAVTAGGFVHQRWGFDQGFDAYSSYNEKMGFAGELEHGVERARDVLERLRDRPFFLFFHTYAVHNPYRPRQPYLARLTGRTSRTLVDSQERPRGPEDGFRAHRALVEMVPGGEPLDTPTAAVHDLAVDLYDGAIAYTDDHLDRLWRAIDELDLAERTLIVVTSDHGELFGEHGQVNHYSLYDGNVMVPLIVFDPALEPGVRRVGTQVRSIDLLPTVLDRVGLPAPAGIDGRSLAPLLRRRDGGEAAGERHAWSYAPASNFGISLRRGDGTSYIARNDDWVSPGPREELLRDGRPVDPADGAAWRDATEERLRTKLPGLRIRLRNPGREPIQVRLWGPHATPQRLKLERIRPGVAVHEPRKPAALELAPGDQVTLIAEGRSPAPFHLVVEHPGRERGRIHLESTAIEGTLWGGWSEDAWRTGAEEPPDGGVVALWWQADSLPIAAEGVEPDDEALRRQLRALGYLD